MEFPGRCGRWLDTDTVTVQDFMLRLDTTSKGWGLLLGHQRGRRIPPNVATHGSAEVAMRDLERVDGHHPGVALTEKRERFIRLVSQGMSNAEASRLVGVNKKTGIRWRFGRTILNRAGEPVHYPPVRTTAHPPRSSRYLSLADRVVITDLRRDRLGVREIAVEIGRAPSTVSRELRRNLDETGRYGPHAAQRKSESRMPRPRPRRVDKDAVFGAAVCELLGRRWSPEQVSHELTVRFADQPQRRLCPESIYQA